MKRKSSFQSKSKKAKSTSRANEYAKSDEAASSDKVEDHEVKLIEKLAIADEILSWIVGRFIPLHDWPSIERTSKQFQRAVHLSYGSLRSLDIFDFFPMYYQSEMTFTFLLDDKRQISNKVEGGSAKLTKLLTKISQNCSSLKEIRGFECLASTILKIHFQALSNIKTLQVIILSNCRFNLTHLVDLLSKIENVNALNLSNCSFVETKTNNDQVNVSDDEQEFGRASLYNVRFLQQESQLGRCFAKFEKLESLNVANVLKLQCSFLPSINASAVKSLNLASAEFLSDYVNQFLSKCINLERLDLSLSFENSGILGKRDFGITAATLRCLPESLKSLKLKGYHSIPLRSVITEEDVSSCLSKCKNLSELLLDDNDYITNAVLQTIIAACPQLTTLAFDVNSVCESLHLLVHLRKLREIRLRPSTRYLSFNQLTIVNDFFKTTLSNFQCLESFSFLTLLSGLRCLEHLADVKTLRRFETERCDITNGALIEFCKKMGNRLETLVMPNCQKISDSSIVVLSNFCKNIRVLNIAKSKISDLSLRKLAASCDQLQTLSIEQKESKKTTVTEQGILALIESCRDLRMLTVHSSLVRKIIVSKEFSKVKYRLQIEYTDH